MRIYKKYLPGLSCRRPPTLSAAVRGRGRGWGAWQCPCCRLEAWQLQSEHVTTADVPRAEKQQVFVRRVSRLGCCIIHNSSSAQIFFPPALIFFPGVHPSHIYVGWHSWSRVRGLNTHHTVKPQAASKKTQI